MTEELYQDEKNKSQEAVTEKKPNPLTSFLHDNSRVKKSQDDELIDIHIGNPLRKITKLLEDIKQQKAFSFTLKGSLGVMGIAVVLGTFGILGGTRAFCEKGVQTRIGKITTLTYEDSLKPNLFSYLPFLEDFVGGKTEKRTILIETDKSALRMIFKNHLSATALTLNTDYFVTGSFDSCTQSITVENPQSIQPFSE
ncbi:MAG TPA: hypothetical protein PKA38_04505 [Candidatus Levybacteria bacterium]|nr:hypothetical protein [Candidatus Levybacteria bacterium]